MLTGANGAGKTNLIEAISLLAPGRGLRRATMEELAFSEGDGAWAVSAEIEGMLGLATLGTGIDPPAGEDAAPSRKCRIDREPVASAAAFADHLRVVWLVPAMDRLVQRAGLRAATLSRPSGARGRRRALEPCRRARALAALAQPPAGRSATRSALARCRRARDGRSSRSRSPPRAPKRCGGLPARWPPRDRTSRFPRGRDRARRLDGKSAARAQRDRDRGPLSRAAERQPRARRRRRPHARRAASVRSAVTHAGQRHPGARMLRPASRRRC